jgi:hypothetical protein
MLPEMNDKDADIESAAEKALEDEQLLSELVNGLTSKKETYRYNCYKVLLLISGRHGERLYPRWDDFVEQLGSANTYRRVSALHLIANLVRFDTENRFEKIFDKYFDLLDDKSVIPAAHVASASGRIVKAKPHLEPSITMKILNIEQTHHNPDRKDLIKGYAIEALSQYFAQARDKQKVIEFVRQQLTGKSPKTRKLAQDFLKEWDR